MQSVYVSHKKAITPIQVPIHGSVRFNIFEREIIDSAYFQRLHFVLQNSTTYTAYPSNKNSRFIHSLGVAKIAGSMLTKSLSNASPSDLGAFLEQCAEFIKKHVVLSWAFGSSIKPDTFRDRLIAGWRETIYGQSSFSHCPFLPTNDPLVELKQTFGGFESLFLVDTLWQAVRICGLVHDIGHLPMSHSFESALESIDSVFYAYGENDSALHKMQQHIERKTSEFSDADEGTISTFIDFICRVLNIESKEIFSFLRGIPIHERRSILLLNKIHYDNKFLHEGAAADFRNLVFRLSFVILFSSAIDKVAGESKERASSSIAHLDTFMRVLKSIISEEIDADRLDYTIRDGLSCGVDIGKFDLERIVNNSILVFDDDSKKYKISFYIRAVSGIEQFFCQRYEGYKYLIFHRTSARTEACLRELISRLFHVCYCYPESQLAKLCDYYGYIVVKSGKIAEILPNSFENLIRLDDANLRTLFFEIRKIIRADELGADVPSYLIGPIDCLIDIVVLRDFAHVYNPFKREYIRARVRRLLGDKFNKIEMRSVTEKLLTIEHKRAEIAAKLKKAVLSEFKREVIAIVDFQFPRVFDGQNTNEERKVFILNETGAANVVQSHSSLLRNMYRYRMQEFAMKIYFVSKNLKAPANDKLRAKIDEFIDRVIVDAYEDLREPQPKRRNVKNVP